MKRELISLTLCALTMGFLGCGTDEIDISNKDPEVEVQK